VFKKKVSERIPVKKIWNHTIELKGEFVLKKRKSTSCSEKRKKKYKNLYKNS